MPGLCFFFIGRGGVDGTFGGRRRLAAASNDDCNDGLSILDKKQHTPHYRARGPGSHGPPPPGGQQARGG